MSAHDLAIEAAADFQRQLGHTFQDLGLLERALTHKSFSNENREVRAPNNERLEFLGDAEPAGGRPLEDQGPPGFGRHALGQGAGPRHRTLPEDGSR